MTRVPTKTGASTRSRVLILSLSASAAAGALLAPGVAFSDTVTASDTTGVATLPEIIVTARRQEEDIQKVPVTVTAISPVELKQEAITDVYDLTNAAPSLSVNTSINSMLPTYSIRGLSTGVATYFAEAPTPDGAVASAPFMDDGQIQVLNGPQGTLFGRSSAAGAILVTPTHPDLDNWGGSLDGILGDYGRLQGTAVLNAPIIPGELALRVAVNANHVNGYTNLIGTSQYLDEVNNQQARIGLEFRKGGFDNYLVASYVSVDQSATGSVMTAATVNPPQLDGLYLLPSILGAATGPIVYGAVCSAAVADGFASNVGTCETQRTALLAAIAPAMESELARTSAGGSAVRSEPALFDGSPDFERESHAWVVDVAQYDFGDVGPVKLNVKNIFSLDSITDNSGGFPTDSIGGRALLGAAFTTGPLFSVLGSDNYIGTKLIDPLPPPVDTYTNDFQIHANVDKGLLTSVLGVYYSDEVVPVDRTGVANLYQFLSGTTNVDMGYDAATGFSAGGYAREVAVYTQETLDLSRWVHGFSLSAGYRFSWDDQLFNTFAAVANYDLPGFVPGTPGTLVPGAESGTGESSSGYNYTVEGAEQITPDWMVYGAVNRAYVPGGVNLLGQTASSLPNYTASYAPEYVLEEELGTKFNVNLGGFHSQLGADIYNNSFTNIIETLIGALDGAAVEYSENVAAAYLRGFEIYGTVVPAPAWEVRFSYNYNEARYTKWVGADPAGVATTNINLANNPFPNMPNQQAHITLVYHAPIPPKLGHLSLSATGYAQSRSYYGPSALRDLQVFVEGGGDPKMGLNAVSQAPYATLNLRADWENAGGSGLDISAFVDNATNTIYATGKTEVLASFGDAAANYAPPIMFGFEVSRKFGP